MRKYHGKFNWYGEVIELETMADDLPKAKSNMMFKLATKIKMNVRLVTSYYKDKPGAWKITEAK